MYRNLKAELIVETCRSTQQRIAWRFANSGLSKVAGEIQTVSEQAADLAAWLAKPHLVLRTVASIGIATIFLLIISVAMNVKVRMTVGSIGEFLQGLDAGINGLVFVGIATFFFITLEVRLKRRRALAAIRELRSLAHIIDMHQLAKDPEFISTQPVPAGDAPKRPQNPAELIAYLDYCADLLSLISKIAALYVQDFDDPVTLVAVNEIENLTNGISRKIWQKIMIFDRIFAAGENPNTPARS